MLSRIDKYKVLKACSSRNGGKKAYKLGVYYKLGGGSNNEGIKITNLDSVKTCIMQDEGLRQYLMYA